MATSTGASSKGWPAILLFGDSITEGIWNQDYGYSFGAALTDTFNRRIQVLGRGFSGYNSSHARAIVDDVIPPADGALDLKLLIVFFGANDAVLPGYEQHVDIAEYKENIKAIVQHPHVKQHGAKVVIITPPPVYEHKRLPPGTRRNAVTKQYAEAAIDVAKETGAEVLKLWHVFMDHAGWKEGGPLIGDINAPTSEELGELFTDGLHLTAKGYQLYFDSLMALLKERLPEIHDFERQYPNWGEAPRYRSE